jgi:hypothetical protein
VVHGVGPLELIGSLVVGGPEAPYAEDLLDGLAPASGAEPLLLYPDGAVAAVGRPGHTAFLGFPLELLAGEGDLQRLMTALLAYIRGDPAG